MSAEIFLKGRVQLCCGDSLHFLRDQPDDRYDSVVTDPPYHLTNSARSTSSGFMGRKWDAPDQPAIDPGFAGWFSGFVDGEGCFHVHKKQVNGCETYDCQFSITLRSDDLPIVEQAKRELGGIGSIAMRPAPKIGGGNPQVRYCISSKADCQRLREVLLAFPLRAKKLRDFEIWSEALDSWISHEIGGTWEEVAYYREKLMAVRQYGAAYHPSQIFFYRFAREALRVLKPGAHLVAFAGTRTYHRLAAGIEDAGFEIRDCISWNYGSGFPKSRNIGNGLGTALKPAMELICLARKPLSEPTVAANVLKWGTGAINIDGCRIAGESTKRTANIVGVQQFGGANHRPQHDSAPIARENGSDAGRWPANIILDGSEEVLAAFPDNLTSGTGATKRDTGAGYQANAYGKESRAIGTPNIEYGDSGSAARFFYTAKADADDRLGSKHPTVKPVDLMQWLVRLVTPKGGLVLDPFAGTGTTAEACYREGMRCMLVERETEYQADIRRRMALVLAGPDERSRESIKAKTNGHPIDHGPLFSQTL